jgi:hypothetical protein
MTPHSVLLLIEAIEYARAKIDAEAWDDHVKQFMVNNLLDCIIEVLQSEQDNEIEF